MDTTVNDPDAGRESTEYGQNPYEGEPDDRRIADPGAAHDAAIHEYVNRNRAEQGLTIHPAEMTGPTVTVDQGPGRDQHGEHQRGDMTTAADRYERAELIETIGRRLAERSTEELRVIAFAPEPAPGAPRPGDADLEVRIANNLYDYTQGNIKRRLAARQIIANVRSASPALYSAPLTLPAECVDVPATGARWQIQDARDERGWHDVTAAGDCNNPQCTSLAGRGDPDEVCVVLVGDAWADGFAHYPSRETVDVRIPAVTA